MKRWFYLFIIISLFLFGFSRLSKDETQALKVTYIANEGFLISSKTKKVLIDSIFRKGYGIYLEPTNDIRKKIETAQPPFDQVNLVMATHSDADHFDSSLPKVVPFFLQT